MLRRFQVRCPPVFWFKDMGDRHAAGRPPAAGRDQRVRAGRALRALGAFQFFDHRHGEIG